MPWLDLPRVDREEMIDSPDQPLAEIDASMADLARVNRWFGGVDAVVGGVSKILKSTPNSQAGGKPDLFTDISTDPLRASPANGDSRYVNDPGKGLRILDIGTGSGDIPRALALWARSREIAIDIVAVDNLPGMLRIARDRTRAADRDGRSQGVSQGIHYVQADALSLPFPAKSFDICTCSLMLHHLGLDAAARVLAQMDRLSTLGFVATDLRRDLLSLALVKAGLTLLSAHPITRHDGPASVYRAFTPREYEKMIALSGVRHINVGSSWYYRTILVKALPNRP